ncbi:MAG: heavy metal translocating P-type ATPase [Bacillota bacterium]
MSDFLRKNRDIVWTAVSGVCLALSWIPSLKAALGFDPAWGAILISGIPLLRMATVGLFTRFDVTAGVLVSIALVAATAIGEYFAAGEVAFIMAIGEILENRTVQKARSAVNSLMRLAPPSARVRRNGREEDVPAEFVAPGDEVVVRAGENIPVDGIIAEGKTLVNQASLTGESMPVSKELGSEVLAGTLNLSGLIVVKAAKTGRDTILARITRLMEEAEKSKAPIVRTADRWARWLVPASLLTALGVWAVTGDITRAVTILVVFCPCALVLATPTAIMAGIGQAAKSGVLIKDGASAEALGKVDTVVFDKTGTLTAGAPSVTSIIPVESDTEGQVLALAASLEQTSNHPLADAVVRAAQARQVPLAQVQDVSETPGQGIHARVDGLDSLVGSRAFLEKASVSVAPSLVDVARQHESLGQSAVFVALDGRALGAIFIADQVREGARDAVARLSMVGIRQVTMLTGDNAEAAAAIASAVGITDFRHSLLPQDKLSEIAKLGGEGRLVAMVGDGINDAPALAKADVGIAMGLTGSGIALETADVVLMADNLGKIEESLTLGRRMLKVITQNLWLSALINAAAIVLASNGWMGPVIGALWHNAGSVLVVANSAMLMSSRPNRTSRRT